MIARTATGADWVYRLLPLIAAIVVVSARYDWGPPGHLYLWSAGQLQSGQFGPHVYDDAATGQAVEAASQGRVYDVYTPNAPTMAVFVLPYAWLDPPLALVVWNLANLAALVLALALIGRPLARLRRRPGLMAALAAAFILSAPMQLNHSRGQVYLWVLLALALVFSALSSRSIPRRWGGDWLAGLGLATALTFKVSGWPIWLILAARGRWRALAWAGLLTAAVIGLTLPWLGADSWGHFLAKIVPERLGSSVLAHSAYQTVGGFWQHLLRYDPQWNPAPVADLPWLARALGALSALAWLGASLWLAGRSAPVYALAVGLVLSVVLAPTAEQYHYLLLLIPLAVALEGWLARPDWQMGLGLLAAVIMLLWPLPYQSPRVQAGWLSLLAYPRLYGAGLLWMCLAGLALGERPRFVWLRALALRSG